MRTLGALGGLGRRLLYWIQRERRERELQEEMEAHRAQMREPERFGSTLRLGDEAREVWGWRWLEQLAQDLRVARRSLAGEPLFLATATTILALAIGANTAIFSVVQAVLLEPLPFRDPSRLVAVWERAPELDRPRSPVAPATFAEWRSHAGAFSELAALDWRSFDLTGDAEPMKVQAHAVSPELFALLGVEPALGRSFRPGEDDPGAPRVALLSHRLWRSRFGGRPDVVGEDVLLNGEPYAVVGVMPARFQLFESYIGLWTPLVLTPEEWRSSERSLRVVARLRAGVRLGEARAGMETVSAALARDRPGAAAEGALVVPLREELAGEAQRTLLLLMAAVGVVLLAACANVGGLLLARGLARRRELAVRAALGAGRSRIARQLLAESLLLAAPAALAGVLTARLCLPSLRRLLPPQRALSAQIEIDGPVLAFTVLVALVAALACGLAPALRVASGSSPDALRDGAAGPRRDRGQALLAAAEVALAMLLAVQAGLLIRSLERLGGQYEGLRPEGLLTVRTALSLDRYWSPARRAGFYEQVLERVEALPGVRSAGYTTSVPLEWKGGGHEIALEGRPPQPGRAWYANHRQVSAGYLRSLGARLVRGRHLTERDTESSPPVAVVNETMARSFWDGRAVGQRLALAEAPRSPQRRRRGGQPWRTVVGVVADVRQMGAAAPVHPEMYLPYRQVDTHAWLRPRDLVVRTDLPPARLAGVVRAAIREVDPAQPVALVRTMDEILDEENAGRRLQGAILTAFAGLALLLAALGVHGVLAYWVAQRWREIGVRIALGARPASVLGAVLHRGARVTVLGLGAGLLGCAALAPLTRHFLFQVAPTDPTTYAVVAITLAVVALAACLPPAWKAATVLPAEVLRAD